MTVQGTLNTRASADAYIINVPDSGQGSSATIFVATLASGFFTYIALVKFILTAIPSNATVSAATLYMTSATNGASQVHTFHRLVRDWSETTATWSLAQTGTSWGTAGCANTTTDYNSTSLGTITFPTAANTVKTLDLTSTVQDWVDGTSPNYGVRISSGSATNAQYHSRSATIKARRPRLEIFYTVPGITYAINGTTVTGPIMPLWIPILTKQDASGLPNYSAWYRHTWRIPAMEMTDFETLYATRGTALTSLVTTDKDAPNMSATYTTGNVISVTGRQQARQMIDVNVEFLIDTS